MSYLNLIQQNIPAKSTLPGPESASSFSLYRRRLSFHCCLNVIWKLYSYWRWNMKLRNEINIYFYLYEMKEQNNWSLFSNPNRLTIFTSSIAEKLLTNIFTSTKVAASEKEIKICKIFCKYFFFVFLQKTCNQYFIVCTEMWLGNQL